MHNCELEQNLCVFQTSEKCGSCFYPSTFTLTASRKILCIQVSEIIKFVNRLYKLSVF